MQWRHATVPGLVAVVALSHLAIGQEYGPPDRGHPGDEMIQAYLKSETDKIHARFLRDVKSLDDWNRLRPKYAREYFHMLGLSPMPAKTPLKATVTGTLAGDGYAVDLLHYQSRPGLYVTGNLYRPAGVKPGKRLPAVFYVCGHSNRGRNGNKTAYQSHGIWFARHGYICLTVDSLQLGEIGATHHGTYREGRWWWHSRGYTPAGVECLNGIRGIDYLISRPDVDPRQIAVTGISGGGAATFWIAAADQRVKAAVPVSGMADLPSYVSNRVINGHCDCMFLYNTFQWPWTRIAALVAPRAMLFTNSDRDPIFPMDANRRVISRLEDLYKLHGAGDFVDAFVSAGGHAYRKDIRRAAYRFINMHLGNDPRVVTDSEVDLVTASGRQRKYPIDPEKLRVFPADSDIPADERNTTIDRHFVPQAKVNPPTKGGFGPWKAKLQAELRRVAFGCFPERIPAARQVKQAGKGGWLIETERGIRIPLTPAGGAKGDGAKSGAPKGGAGVRRVLLVVRASQAGKGDDAGDGEADGEAAAGDWARRIAKAGDRVYLCAPRGTGPTRWTRKNPPNYVERCHVLLGRTVDTGRVWDIAAAARFLRQQHGPDVPVHVVGQGPAAVLAAYAALWEPDIAGAILHRPPLDHMLPESPQFLNVLRVCNVPDVLAMLAPRPLTIQAPAAAAIKKISAIYTAAGHPASFTHESIQSKPNGKK